MARLRWSVLLLAFLGATTTGFPGAASAGTIRPVTAAELKAKAAKTTTASVATAEHTPLPSPDLPDKYKRMLSGAGYNALYGNWRQQLPELKERLQTLQKASGSTSRLQSSGTESLSLRPFTHVVPPLATVNDKALEVSPVNTQSEPSIAISGSKVVIGFNSSFDSLISGSFSGYSYSANSGTTFTHVAGGLPPVGDIFPMGDPSLAMQSGGKFYYATLALDVATMDSYILVYKSTDGGVTFPEAFVGAVAPCTTPPDCDFLDKELITIDRKAGSPFVGRLYLTFTNFLATGGTEIRSCAFKASTGESFGCTTLTTEVAQGSMPATGPDGEVYVAWEQFSGTGSPTGAAIFFAKSVNGGATFSVPGKISDVTPVMDLGTSIACEQPALNGGIRANDFPVIGVDTGATSPFRGNVYVAWNDMGTGDAEILGTRSENGGVTWEVPGVLNAEGAGTDQFFPWGTIMPDGRIGVIWYDRKLDPSNNWWIHVYLGESTDAGETWTQRRITANPFPVVVNVDPIIAPCYMGDYNQITNNGVSFYLAWGDNLNGDPDVAFKRRSPASP